MRPDVHFVFPGDGLEAPALLAHEPPPAQGNKGKEEHEPKHRSVLRFVSVKLQILEAGVHQGVGEVEIGDGGDVAARRVELVVPHRQGPKRLANPQKSVRTRE